MTLTFKDPNGVEWQLWAWPLDGKFDARLAEPADLLSALGQLEPGSDGPTDEELAIAGGVKSACSCWTCRSERRRLFNAGLALGEQKQAARVRELESLAYLGDHHFPDLTYKSRCDELQSELAATKAKLAEVERELSDYKADAASAEEALREDLGKERSKVRTQRAELHSLNKLRRGEVEAAIALRSELAEAAVLRSKLAEVERELASALRVSEGRARQRDELSIAYHRNQTVVEAAKRHDGARRDWLAVERYDAVLAAWGRGIEQALASAGTDADRTEPPQDSRKEENDARRSNESTVDLERRDARPDGGTRHSGGTHQGPECGPEVASSEPRGHEARGSEHVGSGGDGQGVGTGTGSAGSGESSGLAEPPRPEARESIAAQARERIATMSSEEVKGLWDKLGSVGGVQEEIPPGFLDARLSSDGKGTLCLGAAGFTTVRACRHCGVLIAGGPTACLSCAQVAEPKPEPCSTEPTEEPKEK